MYSCITIGGNEEQQNIAKNEIQRLIGHTAGVDEYKESNVPQVWNPLMQMQGILNGALDMTQLNQFMQNSVFFMNGMPMQSQQQAPSATPSTVPTVPASTSTEEAPKAPAFKGEEVETEAAPVEAGDKVAKEEEV